MLESILSKMCGAKVCQCWKEEGSSFIWKIHISATLFTHSVYSENMACTGLNHILVPSVTLPRICHWLLRVMCLSVLPGAPNIGSIP